MWDELNALEHLKIFSKIKGLPPHYEHYIISKCMEDVGINNVPKNIKNSYINNNNNYYCNNCNDNDDNDNINVRRKKMESYNKCDSKKLVKNMSGGEKRRLSLALSLLGNPKIIILDEPTVIINYNIKI